MLTPGHFQSNHFPSNHWIDKHWPDFREIITEIISTLITGNVDFSIAKTGKITLSGITGKITIERWGE